MDPTRFNHALEFAAQRHHGQHYKFNDEHHQISHVYFVGAVLLAHGFSEDTVIAGVLHDVVEDTQTSLDDVRFAFGETVAAYVEQETVDQTLPWEERQHLMQERARTAPPDVKAIKTADMLHQLVLFTDPLHARSQENYLAEHSVEKSVWKFEKLLEALGENWEHPLHSQALQYLARMRERYA